MIFRRHIELNTRSASHDASEVRIALEDDFHHFRVSLQHSNGQIIAIQSSALRTPYSLCSEAATQLNKLVHQQVAPVAQQINRMTNARLQCTHMLDITGLAMAAAARNCRKLKYTIAVPRRRNGRTRATLFYNNKTCLEWDVHHLTLKGPPPFTNRNLKSGFAAWALQNMSVEKAEAALVLRRAVVISLGRERDLDKELTAQPNGYCYVQQPDRALFAKRVIGSTLDFTEKETALCADDRAWLDFTSC